MLPRNFREDIGHGPARAQHRQHSRSKPEGANRAQPAPSGSIVPVDPLAAFVAFLGFNRERRDVGAHPGASREMGSPVSSQNP